MSGQRTIRRLGILVATVLTVAGPVVGPPAPARARPADAAVDAAAPAAAGTLDAAAPPAVTAPVTVAAPPADLADPILRWTFYLLDIYRQAGGGPTVMSRGAAMMYGAAYDAVNSITPVGQPYLRQFVDGPRCAAMPAAQVRQCVDAAVTWAAATVLARVFPAQASFVASARATEDQRIGTGLAVDIGRALGEQSGNEMINHTSNDNSADSTPYVAGTEPGAWRPTGNGCTTAVSPNWGLVRPTAITSGTQFRPPLPGGFTSYAALLASPLYAQQVNEVQSLGRSDSTTRTAEQTRIAFFWANDVAGTYHPPGQSFDHTRIIAQQRGLTVAQNARLFALLALALADAGIVAWGAKFMTAIDLWRPETAIRLAGTDNNPATTADPAWQPLSVLADGRRFSPCFPAYTSGHATFAGAWAAVLRQFFGTDAITFTGTTDDPNARGVTRTFTSLAAAGRENARSRIFLGVHYQFDADAGFAAGTSVGEFVVANRLRPL